MGSVFLIGSALLLFGGDYVSPHWLHVIQFPALCFLLATCIPLMFYLAIKNGR